MLFREIGCNAVKMDPYLSTGRHDVCLDQLRAFYYRLVVSIKELSLSNRVKYLMFLFHPPLPHGIFFAAVTIIGIFILRS
jgi:hypothetical protein